MFVSECESEALFVLVAALKDVRFVVQIVSVVCSYLCARGCLFGDRDVHVPHRRGRWVRRVPVKGGTAVTKRAVPQT
jgi:hypothetical protein